MAVVYALEIGQDTRLEILAKHGIIEPRGDAWYPQKAWLDAFQEIAEEIGNHTLFSIGKAIPEHAELPPQIDTLEKALMAIDMGYHLNHRGGEIGHYTLTSFDPESQTAVMVCNNPYPSEFDRGIITAFLRRFRPADSLKSDVILDYNQPTRLKGADSCTYKLAW